MSDTEGTRTGESVPRLWRAWCDFTSDDIDAVSRWQSDAIDRCEEYGLVFEGGAIGPSEDEEAPAPGRSTDLCTGSDSCCAVLHVHGCWNDRGSCDHPDEHHQAPTPGRSPK